MSIRNTAIGFFIALILQITFTDVIAVMGTGPDLILILTIVLCYMYEDSYPALACATVAALMHDLLLSPYTGIYALSVLLTGILVRLSSRIFNRDNPLPLTGVLAAGTFICGLIQWIIYVMGPEKGSILVMLRTQPVEIIYDLVLGILLFYAIRKVRGREKKSRYYQ